MYAVKKNNNIFDSLWYQKCFLKHQYREMSSVQSSHKQIDRKTKVTTITTVCYNNNDNGDNIPMPFSVSAQGVLDIDNINSSVNEAIVDGIVRYGSQFCVKEMGGAGVPLTLGSNILTWLSNIYFDFQSATIEQSGLMTRVQTVGGDTNTYDFNSLFYAPTGISDPYASNKDISSDEFVGGDAGNYNTAWVFKNPTVIKIKADGDEYQLVLITHYDPAGWFYDYYD